MYVEEPWKGSVLEVHHKRTTDGSDFRVMDPNERKFHEETTSTLRQ